MAETPLNANKQARKTAAQGPGQAYLAVSFESKPVSLDSDEPLNVEGFAYVFAYGGGAVSCFDNPGDGAVLLADKDGNAVSVTTAQLIDVRGIRHISFAGSAVVVVTG